MLLTVTFELLESAVVEQLDRMGQVDPPVVGVWQARVKESVVFAAVDWPMSSLPDSSNRNNRNKNNNPSKSTTRGEW